MGGGLPSSESVHAKIIYCGVAFLFDAMHWCILVTGKDKKKRKLISRFLPIPR